MKLVPLLLAGCALTLSIATIIRNARNDHNTMDLVRKQEELIYQLNSEADSLTVALAKCQGTPLIQFQVKNGKAWVDSLNRGKQ